MVSQAGLPCCFFNSVEYVVSELIMRVLKLVVAIKLISDSHFCWPSITLT